MESGFQERQLIISAKVLMILTSSSSGSYRTTFKGEMLGISVFSQLCNPVSQLQLTKWFCKPEEPNPVCSSPLNVLGFAQVTSSSL